jgi:predicted sugar kinase
MRPQVKVRSFPRIHVTLIDVAGVTHRQYGGIGFSLNTLPIEIDAKINTTNELAFRDSIERRDKSDIFAMLKRLSKSVTLHGIFKLS